VAELMPANLPGVIALRNAMSVSNQGFGVANALNSSLLCGYTELNNKGFQVSRVPRTKD